MGVTAGCLVVLAAGAMLPATAFATDTVTVGETDLASNGPSLDSFTQNLPVFQGDSSAGYVLSSPVDGTITSWSFLSAGASSGDEYELRVLHPANVAGTSFTAAGTSAVETGTGGGGSDVVEGPFTVSIRIHAGDRIALQPVANGDMPIESGTIGQDGIRTFTAPLADGATGSIDPGQTMDSGQVVPIQAVVAAAPSETAPPTISGNDVVGQALTCDPGTWTGSPTFTYQWSAGGTALTGETSATHTIGAAEAGLQDTCTVTATNAGGSASATSAATDGIKPGALPAPANTAPPAISGTTRQFDTLSTTNGLWTGDPTSFSYQWLRCATAIGGSCVPIAGATSTTYALTRDDIGSTIRIDVTATNAQGSVTAQSGPTAIVQVGLLTANLVVRPAMTCTGLTVLVDGSGSVGPDGIETYEINEVNMTGDGGTEDQLTAEAAGNGYAFLLGTMSAAEIESRVSATFDKPTVDVTFGWQRERYPNYNGDPMGFSALAVDPVGILLTVRDASGASATARTVVTFNQAYSDGSRASCPAQPKAQRLVAAALKSKVATLTSGTSGSGFDKTKNQEELVLPKVGCRQVVACTGDVVVTQLPSHGHVAKAPTVLARSFFSIEPGRTAKVPVPLTAAGVSRLRSLRRGRSVRLRVTVTTFGVTGNRVVRSTSVVVRRR